MPDDRLKSAYELAMERFQKKDAEAGIVHTPLTDEQKAAIAEIRSRYQAKIAELEILHRDNLMKTFDPAEREALDAEYRRERERINADWYMKIEETRARSAS